MLRYGFTLMLWSVLIVTAAVLVACGQPAAAITPPDQVVSEFYRWYLGYPGNVLADRAYRDSKYLTDPLKTEVDEIISSFSRGAYDPFLMAQDIPADIIVQDVQIRDDHASVTVEQQWMGGLTRSLKVELQLIAGRWLISSIIPPEIPAVTPIVQAGPVTSPEELVREFYTWYLAYVSGGEELRNPLVDGAYRTSPHLAPDLIAQFDELIASFETGGYDPVLCAQDVPESVDVGEPTISGDTAIVPVSTSFEGHSLEISLKIGEDGWKITAIACGGAAHKDVTPLAEEEPAAGQTAGEEEQAATDTDGPIPADWQVLRDEDHGFEIWYPADWSVVDLPLRDPELDAPIVRLVQILPAEWAAKMSAGGPPDPNLNIVAPISLEVSVGSLQEYRRLYYEMPLVSEVEIGGLTVTLEQDEPGDYQVSRFLCQHPRNSNLRITLVDYISGFPARVKGNEAIVETMKQIVATFSFTD